MKKKNETPWKGLLMFEMELLGRKLLSTGMIA